MKLVPMLFWDDGTGATFDNWLLDGNSPIFNKKNNDYRCRKGIKISYFLYNFTETENISLNKHLCYGNNDLFNLLRVLV